MDTANVWTMVEKLSNGCWMWKGAKMWKGYGHARVKGRVVRVHRLVYQLTRGPIPLGLRVLHTCDERACVNPEHLFLGNDRDNTRDAMHKGRLNIHSMLSASNSRSFDERSKASNKGWERRRGRK